MRTYTDPAVSGATPALERPGMSRLFADAKSRQFDRLLTFDASRLAREQAVFWGIIESLRREGVTYCTAIMPDIDSESPEFQIVAGALQGAAAYERRLTARKVKIGMSVLKDKGHHMGRPKAGCRINEKGMLELDENGERVKGLLMRYPNLRPTEVMSELGITDYFKARKLLLGVKGFVGAS